MTHPEGFHWYCIRTQPKRELLTARLLRGDMQLEVFSPRIRFKRARSGKMAWVNEAMFPGYVFAYFDYAIHHRYVAATRGVAKIVGFGHVPAVVPPKVITELRLAVDDAETVEIDRTIEEGEEIKVVTGPFQGVQAVVSRVLPGRQRVAILMTLLGMDREVEVDVDAVLPHVVHPLAPKDPVVGKASPGNQKASEDERTRNGAR